MREVMDESDQATMREMQDTEAALKVRKPEAGGYTGYCAFCGDDVDLPRRWCGAECRDAWEREQKQRALNGYPWVD